MKLKFLRKNNRYFMRIYLPKGEIEKDVTEFIEGEIQREVNDRIARIRHKENTPPLVKDIGAETVDQIIEASK